ncbi:MAG: UDP-N-acetylglucosamine 2-epimerase (non-hydrolyzing), partial [Acidobacteriia bacterium]|nr:UDP-N-acetylglucosamine 2-epimerase (non-hydrolyzing) [Terriglobia bacterium]
DVNSTIAAALTASKLRIKVAHVEAGLRSFDRTMPEEINRLLTDAIADFLFVTEESGVTNLKIEGVSQDKIFFVGNVMIDSLEASRRLWGQSLIRQQLSLEERQYGVVTLHRPSNVDDPLTLRNVLGALAQIATDLPIVFPVHPRTRKRLEDNTDMKSLLHFGKDAAVEKGIYCIDPLGYIDFMSLVAGAKIILTDSGGIQEETTALRIPCLTLRENTERPVTITHGTNCLVGCSSKRIIDEARRVLAGVSTHSSVPPLWDGKASERIVEVLRRHLAR